MRGGDAPPFRFPIFAFARGAGCMALGLVRQMGIIAAYCLGVNGLLCFLLRSSSTV